MAGCVASGRRDGLEGGVVAGVWRMKTAQAFHAGAYDTNDASANVVVHSGMPANPFGVASGPRMGSISADREDNEDPGAVDSIMRQRRDGVSSPSSALGLFSGRR